ncbi:uncharacterized protein LOC108925380 [Scleropages formosus]|uniref:Uncharacterized LOC108925380 n=1 Tax=Scleropages formosus TaxID=113540 RepID=A0A8C9V2L0_SCLFO|nr:uncharacterized protein LOC108925380 [Scleropages formosus]
MDTEKNQPSACSQTESVSTRAASGDPRSTLRRYLLLKYVQVLLLPQGNKLLLALGALASLRAALLLSSPRVSSKASSVLLGQLAAADGLLLLHWSLGALGGLLGNLTEGLLDTHHLVSLLFLSCLSLEALLVMRHAEQSRRLRTVRCARLASAAVWALGLGELLALRAAEHRDTLGLWVPLAAPLFSICMVVAPLLATLSHCLKGALWLANTWIYYTLFCKNPPRRKSSFH